MTPVTIEIHADTREGWRRGLLDLWQYRELFLAFVERDLKVRYKQTLLGILWVILQPALTSGLFAIIFGNVAKMPKDSCKEVPYLLFYLAAMVPWQCFASGLSQAAASLEGNSGLMSKIYFPRIIVPTSVLCSTVIDFAIGWTLFNIVAAGWGFWTWTFIIFTPVFLVLQLVTALGIGLIFSVLNAQYRDIRYVIPFIIQFGFLITPIIFPLELLPGWLRWGAWINPMAGIIDAYRALLAGNYIPYRLLVINSLTAWALFIFGVWFFQRRLQRIIDII